MIPWREVQRKNFVRFSDLADYLDLSPENRTLCLPDPKFRLNLPLRLAAKMEKNNLQDPLFLQFVPLRKELDQAEGYLVDPVCDANYRLSKKTLKKYAGRALILVSSACAMHCRYCFRQNFDYETENVNDEEELQVIRSDPTIEEVILSGGDPLSLSDQRLKVYLHGLDSIPHVQRIRFHTRFPIGIPERIDDSFLALLASIKKKIYFTIHTNHPKELDEEVLGALSRVGRLGIPLITQSVLLKGVNDRPEVLLELCQTLVNAGILPYYLNLLDQVSGTAHFAVSAEEGLRLIEYVQNRLSGYGVPRLAREIPGSLSKTTNIERITSFQPKGN